MGVDYKMKLVKKLKKDGSISKVLEVANSYEIGENEKIATKEEYEQNQLDQLGKHMNKNLAAIKAEEKKKGNKKGVLDKYWIAKDSFGYLFMKEETKKTKDGEEYQIEYEFADFNIIEKQNQEVYDVTNNQTKKQQQFYFKIGAEDFVAENKVEIKDILKLARRSKQKVIKRVDEIAFFYHLDELDVKEVLKTNCYGFYGDCYRDYPEYSNYQTMYKKEGVNIVKKENFVFPEEMYKDFINLKINDDKVENAKQLLNKLPRTKVEAEIIKHVFAWSIGSVCKYVLRDRGFKVYPLLVIIGSKGDGKTTICETCISSLWNTPSLQKDFFDGVRGARLKHLSNSCFPVYVDELNDVDRYINSLKTSTTKGYLKIPRGQSDGGLTEIVKFFDLAISTNSWKNPDTAMKDRQVIIKYPPKSFNNRLTGEELVILNQNMIHLGRAIYTCLIEFNFDVMFKEIKEELKDLKDKRQRDKLAFFLVGIKILKKLNIFDEIELSRELILGGSDSLSIDLKHKIKSIVANKMNGINYKENDADGDSKVYTIKRCIDEECMPDNFYHLLAKDGIFISTDFNNILLNKNIMPFINAELERHRLPTFKNLAYMSEQLELEYKARKTSGSINKAIKTINMFNDINDLDIEQVTDR